MTCKNCTKWSIGKAPAHAQREGCGSCQDHTNALMFKASRPACPKFVQADDRVIAKRDEFMRRLGN